jgi:hypothetical protein
MEAPSEGVVMSRFSGILIAVKGDFGFGGV